MSIVWRRWGPEQGLRLRIGGIEEAEAFLARDHARRIRHVISIGNPGSAPPRGLDDHPARLLRLTFDDIDGTGRFDAGFVPCTWEQVEQIVAFAADVDGPTLIHCAAGISRSTAAGLILLALRTGPGREEQAYEHLFRVRPRAVPNRRMVWMADHLLGRNGALVSLHRTCWDLEGEPELPPR